MRLRALLLAGLLATSPAAAEEPVAHAVDGRASGYLFLDQETKALQDDPFENPGLLWVEQGRALWETVDGREGKSCASCHGAAERSMRGVGATYPGLDEAQDRLLGLEERINLCRTRHMAAEPYPYESQELLALTAFVGHQSSGMAVAPEVGGPARRFFELGRELYHRRRGQLDLSCANCHEDLVGKRLRGDVISQGQTNGHPVYRILWQTLGSVGRMIEWCQDAVRAERYPRGSEEMLALQLYMAWRGRGLPVEIPGVRR
jgi:sulfur-oxidizing protein SoxA